MGTWGSGNFESDNAGAVLDDVHDYLIGTIVHGLSQDLHEDLGENGESIEPIYALVAVDILATLEEHLGMVAREGIDTVKKWRAKYLAILEADTSEIGSSIPNYKERRRKVAEECFDRLEKAIRDNES